MSREGDSLACVRLANGRLLEIETHVDAIRFYTGKSIKLPDITRIRLKAGIWVQNSLSKQNL